MDQNCTVFVRTGSSRPAQAYSALGLADGHPLISEQMLHDASSRPTNPLARRIRSWILANDSDMASGDFDAIHGKNDFNLGLDGWQRDNF